MVSFHPYWFRCIWKQTKQNKGAATSKHTVIKTIFPGLEFDYKDNKTILSLQWESICWYDDIFILRRDATQILWSKSMISTILPTDHVMTTIGPIWYSLSIAFLPELLFNHLIVRRNVVIWLNHSPGAIYRPHVINIGISIVVVDI